MIELAIVALAVGNAVLIALVAWSARNFTRELRLMLFQADESRKAAWSQGDRAMSRCFAAAMPRSHETARNASGTIDGAQHAGKVADERLRDPGNLFDERRLRAEDAEQRAGRQIKLLREEAAHSGANGHMRAPVTALDSEPPEPQ